MTYRFALLPDVPPGASVLGIESAPEHAALCALGNLSQTEAKSPGLTILGPSVVDGATMIELPPAGTVIALGRLDLGTVAAVAVLVLRALGLWPVHVFRATTPQGVHDAFRVRIRAERIAARGTYRPSAEWAPRPPPTVEQPWPAEPCTPDEDRELAAVAAICSAPLSREIAEVEQSLASIRYRTPQPPYERTCLSLAERVAIVARWLLGDIEHVDVADAATRRICEACGLMYPSAPQMPRVALETARARVEASRRALAEEASSVIAVVLPRCNECGNRATRCRRDFGTFCEAHAPAMDLHEVEPLKHLAWHMQPGAIADLAIVRSAHPEALELGSCVAPVVAWMEMLCPCDRSCGSYGGCGGQLDCALCHLCDEGDHCSRAQKRVTIAGWAGPDGQTRYIDTDRLHARLNRLELQERPRNDKGRVVVQPRALWVATADRCVPPASDGTRLSEEAIVREVLACLR